MSLLPGGPKTIAVESFQQSVVLDIKANGIPEIPTREEAEAAKAEDIKETIDLALLHENYLGVRRAIADFLRTNEATSVLELQRLLSCLDKMRRYVRDLDLIDDVVNPDLDPDYNIFSVDTLFKTAHAIRVYADMIDGPLRLCPEFQDDYRAVKPREIRGMIGGDLLHSLNEKEDCSFLEATIMVGFMDIDPSVPSPTGITFQVVIRGKHVGIFNDADEAHRCCDGVPKSSKRGCKTYFDAFAVFAMEFLRGHVGVYVLPN